MLDEQNLVIKLEVEDNTQGEFSQLLSILERIEKLMYGNMLATKSVAQSFEFLNTKTKSITQSSNKMNKSMFKTMVGFSSLKAGVRALSNAMATSIEKSNAYIENLNLFEVAMKDNIHEAHLFASALSENFGMDKSEIIRYTGMFASLAESMGNTTDNAFAVSKALTTISYDLASLYNRKTPEVMTALQAGLVGQTKPLRSLGIDTTYGTLQKYADDENLGIQVKLLSQADKQLLRTIAIIQQSKNAWGDMAKTIEQPANQIRVFKAQVDKVARGFGNLFQVILGKVLPAINAFLMIIFELLSALLTLTGFEMPTYNEDNGYSAISEDLDDAGASADKLKKKLGLLPFDEITNISTKKESDSDYTAGAFGGVLGNEINELMEEYNKKLEVTQMKATAIRDRVMEWLGFTKLIDEKTGEVKFKMEELAGSNLGNILLGLGAVATIFAGFKIAGIIGSFIEFGGVVTELYGKMSLLFSPALQTFLTQMVLNIQAIALYLGTTFGTALAVVGAIVAVFIALGVAMVDLWNTSETFRATIIGAIDSVFDALKSLWEDVFVPVGRFLDEVFSPIFKFLIDLLIILYDTAIKPLADLIGTVFFKALGGIAEILSKTVFPIIGVLIDLLTWLWKNAIMPVVNILVKDLLPTFKTVFGTIKTIIEGVSKVLGGLIDLIVGLFTLNGSKAGKGLATMFSGIGDVLKGVINLLIDGINAVIGLPFKQMRNLMNSIRNIDILGVKPFTFIQKDIVPVPQIPKLADGGVITRPMMYSGAITGENYRKEAIIPLQNSKVVEDFSLRISDNIVSALGEINNQPIINKVYLDGTYIQENIVTRNKNTSNQFGKLVY